jgi:hypothetical protein
MKELLKRGALERGGVDAERVEGLGAAHFVTGYEDPNYRKTTMAERYEANLGKEDLTYGLPGVAPEDPQAMVEEGKGRREKKSKKDKDKKHKKHKKEKKENKAHKRSRSRPRVHRSSKRSKRD